MQYDIIKIKEETKVPSFTIVLTKLIIMKKKIKEYYIRISSCSAFSDFSDSSLPTPTPNNLILR